MTLKPVSPTPLDLTQYTTDAILHYQAIFGEDFVSPGGQAMAIELIEQLDLPPRSIVLDVGCGLGGSAFVMARRYGFAVEGIDLSCNMLALAQRKLETYGLQDRVTLHHQDCLEWDKAAHYHGIYSRDVFLHIHDKARLFRVLKSLLKVGGKLLFTDYCCGHRPWGADFSHYVARRNYDLHTVPDYGEMLLQAGFRAVSSHDITDRLIHFLHQELNRMPALDIRPATRKQLEHNWQKKLSQAQRGDHRWGLFSATRAS